MKQYAEQKNKSNCSNIDSKQSLNVLYSYINNNLHNRRVCLHGKNPFLQLTSVQEIRKKK